MDEVYVPPRHAMHADASEAPVADKYRPEAQALHEIDPAAGNQIQKRINRQQQGAVKLHDRLDSSRGRS